MGNLGKRLICCLLALLLTSASSGLRAEVSADPYNGVNLLILGITEGPDPIPQYIWSPVRDIDPIFSLNPDGAERTDGRPAVAFNPTNGMPHVVWAYDALTDHDVALSFWTGSGWSDIEFLTDTLADELDPRITFGDEGTAFVVWWEKPLDQVWMSIHPTEVGMWQNPEPVTGMIDDGRRPSVISAKGLIMTAYERDGATTGQELVVATRVGAGIYDEDIIATTQSDKALNVILHYEFGTLWLDWRHSDTEFAYSVFEAGNWSALTTLPWTGETWTREEEARRLVRGLVIGD